MKFLLTFFCITILSTQCVSNKLHKQSNNDNRKVVMVYKYYTRGYYKEHHVQQNKVKTFLDYAKSKFTYREVVPIDWAKALDLLNRIDFKEFENLEAPSNDRHTDQVQHGELTIKINTSTFRSRSFDHGNPPDQIKALVTHLLYMSEGDAIQK